MKRVKLILCIGFFILMIGASLSFVEEMARFLFIGILTGIVGLDILVKR